MKADLDVSQAVGLSHNSAHSAKPHRQSRQCGMAATAPCGSKTEGDHRVGISANQQKGTSC